MNKTFNYNMRMPMAVNMPKLRMTSKLLN